MPLSEWLPKPAPEMNLYFTQNQITIFVSENVAVIRYAATNLDVYYAVVVANEVGSGPLGSGGTILLKNLIITQGDAEDLLKNCPTFARKGNAGSRLSRHN